MKKVKRYLGIIILVFVVFAAVGYGSKAQAAGSYKIRINKQQNCVTIYKTNEKGKLKPIKAMTCSVGWGTPLGSFPLKEKIRWHVLDGPVYGQYCTRITGHILFHSVWYHVNGNPATLSNLQYNKLGTTASHGCVRLCVADAKWIYDNVPSGTTVEIYNAKDPGPLGKPDAIKLPGGQGWDPTDVTNKANPYNKKKPVIKLKKVDTSLVFASKFSLDGLAKAKNTTGFDCTKLMKCKITYRQPGVKKAKKVKKINTRKVGKYTVEYSVTDEIGRKAKAKIVFKVKPLVMLTSININTTDKTLYLGTGKSSDASCTVKLKSYKPSKASITEVGYVSSDTKVAKVSKDGKVTAVAPGTAVIEVLAKDGSGLKQRCTITVMQYATGVTLTAPQTSIVQGGKMSLAAKLAPATATGGKKVTYTYTSSDNNVATVDKNGTVTAVAPGTAVITVSVDGAAYNKTITSQVTINVTADSTSKDVSQSAIAVQ